MVVPEVFVYFHDVLNHYRWGNALSQEIQPVCRAPIYDEVRLLFSQCVVTMFLTLSVTTDETTQPYSCSAFCFEDVSISLQCSAVLADEPVSTASRKYPLPRQVIEVATTGSLWMLLHPSCCIVTSFLPVWSSYPSGDCHGRCPAAKN